MWSLLHNPSTHSSAWSLTPDRSIFILLPWSVRAWFTNWKSYQISNFKRRFCCLPPLEIQSWNPPCVWNSKLHYPPCLQNSSPRAPTPSLGIPSYHPWYSMDIFWNYPIKSHWGHSWTQCFECAWLWCLKTQFIKWGTSNQYTVTRQLKWNLMHSHQLPTYKSPCEAILVFEGFLFDS